MAIGPWPVVRHLLARGLCFPQLNAQGCLIGVPTSLRDYLKLSVLRPRTLVLILLMVNYTQNMDATQPAYRICAEIVNS